jgi:hypothetical protein
MMQILYIIVQLEVVIAVGVCRIEALQALSHFYAGGHEHRMFNVGRSMFSLFVVHLSKQFRVYGSRPASAITVVLGNSSLEVEGKFMNRNFYNLLASGS